MASAPRLPGFVYLPSLERAAKRELTEADRRRLEAQLRKDPEAGSPMIGTGGIRKLRFARPREGRSGGLRVIYYYRSVVGRIYMLTLYAKNVQANLSMGARNKMKALTERLDAEP
jgi:hypothetical protein